MRIAHLVTGGDVAGGQAVALQLARAARNAGHEALFVSPTTGRFTEAVAADGFPVEVVDVRRTFRVHGALRLARLLRSREVDVLHTHVHVAPNVLGRLAARAGRAAVVSHLHIENHFRPQRLARAPLVVLDNATARLCARLVAVCEATRRAFERQGFPAESIETVHNGVDAEALAARPPPGLRAELGLSPDALVIGLVGRLAPVKGQRELLEAVARLRPAFPSLQAVVVGDDLERGGAYRAELEHVAHELEVGDAVRFTGFRPDAADALQELDAVVFPSWIEGLPLTVLEAMAHGKPVVATAVGGTPEAVADGEAGLLVPPRDVAALAAGLERILADGGLRVSLGRAGAARVRRDFTAEAMERRILEIYAEVRG
jgi:glycosyltransferase involved in cell wall biosynthesis